jgi:hypothetical protein
MQMKLHPDQFESRLTSWVVRVTRQLIEKKRYQDVLELITVLKNYEFLNFTALDAKNIEANNWLNSLLSDFESHLSFENTHLNLNDQAIYKCLQALSDFVELNKLAIEVVDRENFIKDQIPPDSNPRIKLDWLD